MNETTLFKMVLISLLNLVKTEERKRDMIREIDKVDDPRLHMKQFKEIEDELRLQIDPELFAAVKRSYVRGELKRNGK